MKYPVLKYTKLYSCAYIPAHLLPVHAHFKHGTLTKPPCSNPVCTANGAVSRTAMGSNTAKLSQSSVKAECRCLLFYPMCCSKSRYRYNTLWDAAPPPHQPNGSKIIKVGSGEASPLDFPTIILSLLREGVWSGQNKDNNLRDKGKKEMKQKKQLSQMHVSVAGKWYEIQMWAEDVA